VKQPGTKTHAVNVLLRLEHAVYGEMLIKSEGVLQQRTQSF